MSKLSVKFCGVEFQNPFVLPSGIITEILAHKSAIDAGVGGVTLKSLTYERREGNPIPRVWKYEHGMINSVGLRNPGIHEGSRLVKQFLLQHSETPVIVSLFATKIKEFLYLVEKIIPLHPTFIELNLSCPNVEMDFGKSLGMAKGAAGEITKEVKKIARKVPILCKLSPNVDSIGDIAKTCEANGADGIVAINAVRPGMIIDINKKKPVLGSTSGGGTSGAGIFPIALGSVYEIYESVKIPILGIGGVTAWQDAIVMIMAGATLVGVGTATYMKGMKVYEELKKGVSEYMQKERIKNLKELVGVAHQ